MRKYILLFSLLLLVTACANQTKETADVQSAQPDQPAAEPDAAATEPQPDLPSPPQEEAPIQKQQNIIEINADSFGPAKKTITRNTKIIWVNNDDREHKVACYLDGNRITTSANLKKGDSFGFTFIEYGEYTCIDAIYGLRSTVKVVLPSSMPTTGMASLRSDGGALTAPLAAIAVCALILLLFFIYGRKHNK